ncbi:MAG: hypothetical protein NVSMB1_09150 [Polyangiales bacterium]
MEALESVLASLSLFERLRADEIGRIARQFSRTTLAKGETRSFAATLADARLVVVVHGLVKLTVREALGAVTSTMRAGDRYGDLALLSGHLRETQLQATRESVIATVDQAALENILAEFPAVALPLATEMASELRELLDRARQLLELHAEGLPLPQLQAAVEGRRRSIERRGARVARLSTRGIFRRLVVERGTEPPFFMLLGFSLSLGLARLVVGMIFKFKLEKQLFALIPGSGPNPMHVHHFNYGLILIGISGIAALFPLGRRVLRGLAFLLGFGCGLVFDEFALFWNLNPDYRQGGSLIAAAIGFVVLVQLTYFRRFWLALVRRFVHVARTEQ